MDFTASYINIFLKTTVPVSDIMCLLFPLPLGIDGSIAQNGTDWFNYHSTSPCIFPVGFCEVNGIELTPPRGL
jgi:hypothetical protein